MTSTSRFTALLLIPLLLRLPLCAQDAASLRIRDIPESVDQNTLAVEVTDARGAVVADAAVTFRLPEEGPDGTFADGTRVAVVYTNHSGEARISGIRWTAIGTRSVRVTATKGTAHAGILLEREAGSLAPPPITPKLAVKIVPTQVMPTASKPIAQESIGAVQPASPQPKPTMAITIATKATDQKAIPPKPTTQKPIATDVVQSAANAVPPPASMPAPTIEPPHMSITSVSRKQADPGQISSASPPGAEPNVVITSAGQRSHGGRKKWIILAAIAAGAAGGAAYMLSRGKSSTADTTTSSSGVSIGAPTISIGAPQGQN